MFTVEYQQFYKKEKKKSSREWHCAFGDEAV